MKQFTCELRAELSRARRLKVPHILFVCYFLVTLGYLVALVKHSPWIYMFNDMPSEHLLRIWGFFPDPSYTDQEIFNIGGAAMTISVAPVAHALFFPVITLIVVGRLDGDRLLGRPCCVSAGRGWGLGRILAMRVVVAVVCVVGAFAAYSVVIAVTMMLSTTVLYSQIEEFVFRLLLCLVLCVSFAVIAALVVSLFGKGTFVLGILLLASYLGFWVSNVIQSHLTWWSYVCAPAPVGDYIVPTLQFAMVSALAAIAVAVAYLGVHRLRS